MGDTCDVPESEHQWSCRVSGRLSGPLRALFRGIPGRWLAAGAAVIAVVAVVAIAARVIALRPPGADAALETCRAYQQEWRELRTRGRTDEEWEELRVRSLSAIAPVVASLERTAGVRDRVAQQLFGPAAIRGRRCFVESPTLRYRLAVGLLLAVHAVLLGYHGIP